MLERIGIRESQSKPSSTASGGDAGGRAPIAPGQPRCHVVIAGGKAQAECESLSGAALADVRTACASWRDMEYVIKRLRQAVDAHGLTGVALLSPAQWGQTPAHEGRSGMPRVPAGIDVPFEPMELDETHPMFAELMAAHGSRIRDPRDDADGGASLAPRTGTIKRWIVRSGLPVAMLVIWINPLMQFIVNPQAQRINLVMLAAMVATLVLIVLWHRMQGAQWFLIPGGVVVREGGVRSWGVKLSRLTPADTVLVIQPFPPGWRATLWRGKRQFGRTLTGPEAEALLAAWRSPVATPSESQLSDLR